MKTPVFTGSAVAVVTPFHTDGSVNYEKYAELIDMQIQNGTDAIVAVGTTGENATLSGEEHRDLMKCAVEAASGRVPVICSTGSNDTAYGIETSKAAEKAGADALLWVTPYYNKTSQHGLIRHYKMMLDAVGIPAILYHIPGRTGLTVKPETFAELSRHPMVAGIKEASGNVSYAAKLISLCGDDLPVYSGNDDLTVPLMSLGAKGVISVLANILPRETHEICSLCLQNDFLAARDLAMKYMSLANALFADVNPVPVKEAMNMMGLGVGPVRPPLFEMTDGDKNMLFGELKKHDLVK